MVVRTLGYSERVVGKLLIVEVGVLGRFCGTILYVDEFVDRNIVSHYYVILSGWPEVMNYSGVVVKTLYLACVVVRISGRGGY